VKVGDCPSCGAPVEFNPGGGKVKVCAHCSTVVLRGEAKLEDLGRVAELLDTDSPLKVGLFGSYKGSGSFQVSGRIQKSHGSGVWDEWCLQFDDGRHAWLSESEGEWNIMFSAGAVELAPWSEMRPLSLVSLRDKRFVVEEVGEARTTAAEGQLPDFAPNHQYLDATGPGGVFASVDYSGERPEAFVGNRITLSQLGFDKSELGSTPKRAALKNALCPNCNGPLALQAPDATKRVACPYCGALHEVAGGKLAFLELLEKPRIPPKIDLGKKGTLEGVEWVVIAFLVRGCEVDGNEYLWDEYLLFNREKGFRWLMCANGHWTFLTPIAAGEVVATTFSANHGGQSYKFFQSVNTVTHFVLGECYWEVSQGERGWAAEYVNPPRSINQDMTANEVTFTLGKLIDKEDVEKAFSTAPQQRPSGIAPAQPNPAAAKAKESWTWAGLWSLGIFATFLIFSMMSFSGPLHGQVVQPPPGAAPGSPESQVFSPEFEVPAKTGIAIEVTSNIDNDWLAVQTDLVNVASGEVISVYGEAEYYHGVTDGESWSEGGRAINKSTSEVDKGAYVARFTPSWDRGKHPVAPSFNVTIKGDGPGPGCPCCLILLLFCWPIFLQIRSSSFETTRWNDSIRQSPYWGA
jgi:Domain of unknown function (DUF4178)